MFGFLKKLFGLDNNNEEILNALAGGAILVDVRTKEEYAQGSVIGAINIPLNNITSNLEKFKNQSSIIVFCASGNRSRTAKMILEENRIKNVINGGSWKDVNGLL
jgi:phage shock protein E